MYISVNVAYLGKYDRQHRNSNVRLAAGFPTRASWRKLFAGDGTIDTRNVRDVAANTGNSFIV